MNKEDELFIAKKTAERAGYKVTMPGAAPAGDGAPAPAGKPAPRHMSRAEYDARKNGQAVPSFADRLERLAQAARTAEEAGYTVRKMTAADRAALQQAAQQAAPAPAPAAEPPKPAEPAPAPAPEATPAAPPAEDKPKTPAWLANASRFMGKED